MKIFAEKQKFHYFLILVSMGIAVLVLGCSGGVRKACNKLTYIEYSTLNSRAETYITVADEDMTLSQEFIMPYDIFYGISVQIGTFGRDNNSIWKIMVSESETEKVIAEKEFNASLINDTMFHLYTFKKNYPVNKGEKYILTITPVKLSYETALAFYCSNGSGIEDSKLFVDYTERDGDLCIAVYGGDRDFWWTRHTLIIFLFLVIMVCRAGIIMIKGDKIYQDRVLLSLLCTAVVYLCLFSFGVAGPFTDEMDNLRGGMIIANGGVLYRDYVTQHTPVTYYLCGLFALLGAGSVQQFRLSYYIFEALVWGSLYYRHSEYFGKKKMMFLAVLETIFIASIVTEGYKVVSDNLQGLCFVVLLLEFIRYYQDKKLDWGRSIIVSCCIWGSCGAAFISVYALIWVVVGVVIMEMGYLFSNKLHIGQIIRRYYKLLVSAVVPLIYTIEYFRRNDSLITAYQQAYLFNREVYSQYMGGMGEKISQLFVDAYKYFFNIVADNFNSIIVAKASNVTILQLFIIIAAIITIIGMVMERRYVEALLLFNVMCCSATRGYGFHGLAAWYIAILIMVIFAEYTIKTPKIYYSILGVACVILFSTYVNSVANNLLYKQGTVGAMDTEIIKLTEDNDKILIDAYCFDSLYLCYKNRYPANRAVYMLPWYMDWYEQDTIDDLLSNMPKLVVYNENVETWGYRYYANAFLQELKANYVPLSDNPDDSRHSLWIKKQDVNAVY